jgi:hypothetical protein
MPHPVHDVFFRQNYGFVRFLFVFAYSSPGFFLSYFNSPLPFFAHWNTARNIYATVFPLFAATANTREPHPSSECACRGTHHGATRTPIIDALSANANPPDFNTTKKRAESQ